MLSNAIDAVEKLPVKWIRIKSQSSETETKIIITDSGQGIPPEIRQRIYDPFFTTKDVNEGTGLGLSLVRQIMVHHGGDLKLDDLAANTSFVLNFPKSSFE